MELRERMADRWSPSHYAAERVWCIWRTERTESSIMLGVRNFLSKKTHCQILKPSPVFDYLYMLCKYGGGRCRKSEASYPGSSYEPGYEARKSEASYPGSSYEPGYEARKSEASYPGSSYEPGYEARKSEASYPGSSYEPGYEARKSSLIPRFFL